MHIKDRGFTIVELLIVIVVIGILASITIVSYQGIQKQAYNAQVVLGVKQYLQVIEAYKVTKGYYPITTREAAGEQVAVVCLGEGYTNGTCGKVSGTTVYEDAAFNTELAKVARGTAVSSMNIAVGPESFVGAVYGIDYVDTARSSTGYGRTIQYALRGNAANCVIAGAWSYALQNNPPMIACEINLESVPAR